MSKKVEFEVKYDGIALQNHSMDVRDLAPAMLSLGLLFDEANRVLNEDRASVKLHVKAQEPGSFEIIFELLQEDGLVLNVGKGVLDVLTLIGTVAGGVGGIYGAWKLIKWLKGKTPEKITDLKNGNYRIEHNGEVIEVDINSMKLYRDIPFRRATEEVLEPIKNEGIDSFEVTYEQSVMHRVTDDDVAYYTLEEQPEEKILEDEWKRAYTIVYVPMKDENKWKLYDGETNIYAIMEDEDFQRKFDERSISFRKGDILVCRVKYLQYRTESGFKNEYIILEVLEIKEPPTQIRMFKDDEET